MKCKSCGRDISFNQKFCAYCGSANSYYIEPTSDRGQVNPHHNDYAKNNEVSIDNVQFTQNNFYYSQTPKSLDSGTATAAKIFIIIGMVLQFYLVYPLIVGTIALNKLKLAQEKKNLTTIGIISIFLCSIIGGILILSIDEKDFK